MASYTVQPGESWASIAGHQLGDQRQLFNLANANGGMRELHPGETINIPGNVAPNPYISDAQWAQAQSQGGNVPRPPTTANFQPLQPLQPIQPPSGAAAQALRSSISPAWYGAPTLPNMAGSQAMVQGMAYQTAPQVQQPPQGYYQPAATYPVSPTQPYTPTTSAPAAQSPSQASAADYDRWLSWLQFPHYQPTYNDPTAGAEWRIEPLLQAFHDWYWRWAAYWAANQR